MIDVANKYKDQLKELFYCTWYDMRYKYYNNHVYCDEFELENSNWKYHDFVSTYDGQIIGHISYIINRLTDSADNLGVINFHIDNPLYSRIFAVDVIRVLRDIFEKYNLSRLTFRSVMGDNPSLSKYRRIVNKFGGRVVGYWTSETRLMDNKLYDMELYEILKQDFVRSINCRVKTHVEGF